MALTHAIASSSGSRWVPSFAAGGCVLATAFLYTQAPDRVSLVAVLIACVAATTVARLPLLLAAVVGFFIYTRVGPAAVDLSVADATLLLATAAAISFVPWTDARFQRMLRIAAIYLGLLALAVAASPNQRSILEWFHRVQLLVGAVMVGAAVARAGVAQLALRLYLLACAVVAVAAVANSAASGFQPAYPLGLHKNAAGALIGMGITILVVARQRVGLTGQQVLPAQLVFVAGMAATQARGASVALIVALLVWVLRERKVRHAGLAVTVAVVALLAAVRYTNESEAERIRANPAAEQFSSYNTRVSTYGQAFDVWRADPIFGAGPRYFYNTPGGPNEPHNAVISALAESGIVGLLGLVLLYVLAWRVLARRRNPLDVAAQTVLLQRFADSLLGILWVAGTGALPWFLVGLALGDDSGPPQQALGATCRAVGERPIPT